MLPLLDFDEKSSKYTSSLEKKLGHSGHYYTSERHIGSSLGEQITRGAQPALWWIHDGCFRERDGAGFQWVAACGPPVCGVMCVVRRTQNFGKITNVHAIDRDSALRLGLSG